MKHIHRELVKAEMERAREQGKRIGRPRVTEWLEFLQRFTAVIQRIGPGGLSRRKAAKELLSVTRHLRDSWTPKSSRQTFVPMNLRHLR